MPTESAVGAYSGLDSHGGAWDAKGMREQGEGRRISIWIVVGALAIACWASLIGCRGPYSEDGAGGQSGDEGRRPRSNGVGGSGAQSLQPS